MTSSFVYSNLSLTVLQWSGGTISDGFGKASSDCSRGSKVCSAQHSICAQVMAWSSVNKTQCVARSIYCSQFTIIHSFIHFIHSYVCMFINTVFIRRSVCLSFELTVLRHQSFAGEEVNGYLPEMSTSSSSSSSRVLAEV